MRLSEKIIYFGFFGLIIIIEGIGILSSRPLSLLFTLLFSLILIIFIIISKKKLILNNKPYSYYFIYIFLSILSTCFSQNLVHSLLYLLFYNALFIIFIYTNINKIHIAKPIIFTIYTVSVVYCIYSMFLPIIANSKLFIPSSGYQFVYSTYSSHNHLGDFLILPLISCFYILLTNKMTKLQTVNYVLFILFFLPFFYFSFSRSAYLSLSLSLIIMVLFFIKSKLKNFNIVNLGLLLSIVFLSILFIFSMIPNLTPPTNYIHAYLIKNENLRSKLIFAARGEYTREAVFSIIEHPLIGVGPGNFILASQKYNPISSKWTESSHNIFLDIASEQGILAVIVFIVFLVMIIKKSKKNVYFFMALGLILNFQTDYTFRIYSFLLLFFILLGLCYEEKEKLTG